MPKKASLLKIKNEKDIRTAVFKNNISLWKDLMVRYQDFTIMYENIKFSFSEGNFYVYHNHEGNDEKLLCVEDIVKLKNSDFLSKFIDYFSDFYVCQKVLSDFVIKATQELLVLLLGVWKAISDDDMYKKILDDAKNFYKGDDATKEKLAKDGNSYLRDLYLCFGGFYAKYIIIMPFLYMMYHEPIKNQKEYIFEFNNDEYFDIALLENKYGEIKKQNALDQIIKIFHTTSFHYFIDTFYQKQTRSELEFLFKRAQTHLDTFPPLLKDFYIIMKPFFTEDAEALFEKVKTLRSDAEKGKKLFDGSEEKNLAIAENLLKNYENFNNKNKDGNFSKQVTQLIKEEKIKYDHEQKSFLKRIFTDHNNKFLKNRIFVAFSLTFFAMNLAKNFFQKGYFLNSKKRFLSYFK